MSELPMRGHFRYLRFKTFPMTPRTPQCEVFCPLLSSSEHSGVSEDSQPPTFPSVGLHPHTWPKWGCDRKAILQGSLCAQARWKDSTSDPNTWRSRTCWRRKDADWGMQEVFLASSDWGCKNCCEDLPTMPDGQKVGKHAVRKWRDEEHTCLWPVPSGGHGYYRTTSCNEVGK